MRGIKEVRTLSQENIHNKGFNLFDDYNRALSRDSFEDKLDKFNNIKIGTKTLEDAVLDLGSLKKAFPNGSYANKAYIQFMIG